MIFYLKPTHNSCGCQISHSIHPNLSEGISDELAPRKLRVVWQGARPQKARIAAGILIIEEGKLGLFSPGGRAGDRTPPPFDSM